MRIFLVIFLLFTIAACQQEDTSSNSKTSPEATASEANKASEIDPHAGHDHSNDSDPLLSPLLDLPYDVIESDTECAEPIVMEFFAYQCPACYKLEEYADKWKKQNNGKIKFEGIPTHLGNQQFGSFLIVHQAAKTLGILDKFTPMAFHRIHVERQAFASQEDAVSFLVSAGADEEKAVEAISDEESIKNAMDTNFRLLAKYKITSVPTILVNHKYMFNASKAGGSDKVFDVVNETLKLPSNCNK